MSFPTNYIKVVTKWDYVRDFMYCFIFTLMAVALWKGMYREDKVARKLIEVCQKENIPVNCETNNICGWHYVKILAD